MKPLPSGVSRPTPIPGFLDDYAFVACGLLDLYEATLRTEWLRWAEELQLRQDVLFWDAQGGGYYCSQPSDPTLLLKLKQDQDGAEPSANSVSALNLLRLSHYTGRPDWARKAEHLLAAFSDRLTRVPIALPHMVRALLAQHHTLKQRRDPGHSLIRECLDGRNAVLTNDVPQESGR
ncbi:unnamed protein product [Gadus morhua 'NCC']